MAVRELTKRASGGAHADAPPPPSRVDAAAALARRIEERLGALPTAAQLGLGLTFLLAVSTVVRIRSITAGYWIDEGLSVGISSHPLHELPHLLREDGSPPLYYALLHLWMPVAGTGEVATHALSLVFALLTIPAALWAGWSLFGRRVGWICAALAAVDPFLTIYGQETRMYSLVALFSVLATACFLHAFVDGRRRYLPPFSLLLALLLYTHNWSIFFGVGAAVAGLLTLRRPDERRRRAIDGVLAFAGAGVLFAPWLPTLLFQAAHTGAPWSTSPSFSRMLNAPQALAGGAGSAMALLLSSGVGLAPILRGGDSRVRRLVLTAIALGAATIVAAWISSQFSPAWTGRYMAILLGPVLLLVALGVSRGGWLGAIALALVLGVWVMYAAPDNKSNANDIAARAAPLLRPGDLVLSTHPEQIPVLHYYLPPGLRYATTLGPVADPTVMDWRDALTRLDAAKPRRTIEPLLDRLPVGRRLLIVNPVFQSDQGWTSPWTKLVRQRAMASSRLLLRDRRFARVAVIVSSFQTFKAVRATLYRKIAR